jgi:hypothetical protein
MIKKITSVLEQHVEKIILGVVGIICIWLLITRVLFSPNVATIDNRKFSPGEIDHYVSQQAELLEHKLNQDPQEQDVQPYKAQLPEFLAKMDSAISQVDTSLYPPMPFHSSMVASGKAGPWRLPEIGEVTDVAVEHIRAAAYVPTLQVTEEVPYENAAPEPNDIDLVSVEAKFDYPALRNRFFESFAGDSVPEQWRDPCLAEPIFAAVHLQRQELLADSVWSDWQNVPRTKIDHRRRIFEIIEDAEDLPPGGVKVRLLQFNDPDVRIDLLQPQAYQIASPKEMWFPPTLHRRFVEEQKKQELEERRKAREEEKEQREREREDRLTDRRDRTGTMGTTRYGSTRSGRRSTYEGYGDSSRSYSDRRTARPRRGRDRRGRAGETGPYGDAGPYGDMGPYGDTGPYGERGPTTRRQRDDSATDRDLLLRGRGLATMSPIDEVYDEFDEISLTPYMDFSKMREPLAFWAHDDTVDPGKTYRYRIRLGFFNPVADAGQSSNHGRPATSPVILWSDFSNVTTTVDIPNIMYFFAKDIQEAAKSVSVQVCKYVLGYWRSESFAVEPGEVIGKVVEPEQPKTDDRLRRLRSMAGPPEKNLTEPEAIDYSTGAIVIDAVPVNDWTSGPPMRPRNYFDMLYSFDGTNIEHMPTKMGCWPEDLLTAYQYISKAEREPKEPLRAWDSQVGRRRLRRPAMEGYEGMEEYEELMMMEQMMQERSPYGPRR